MNAKEFKSIILFMANHWDKDTAIEIFGEVMGNHFFSKWTAPKDPDLGTMKLFYEMGTDNLQKLLDYIEWYNQRIQKANQYDKTFQFSTHLNGATSITSSKRAGAVIQTVNA